MLARPDGRRFDLEFPPVLIAYKMPTYFAAELVGAVPPPFPPLVIIRRSLPGPRAFLGQFSGAPQSTTAFRFEAQQCDLDDGNGVVISGVAMVSARDREAVDSRYPELREHQHQRATIEVQHTIEGETFSPIYYEEGAQPIWLDNTLSISSSAGAVRARYFQGAWMVPRTWSAARFTAAFEERHDFQDGVRLHPALTGKKGRELLSAANLASLLVVDRVGETTITRFLELNDGLLRSALAADRIIPQPLLPWLAGNPDPDEKAIQPDFLFVDADGRGHICEMKLPLLDKASLTTGRRRRRDLIKPVRDGVAQLANYNEYFSHPAHRDYLAERFAVTIDPQDLRLVLVVGSNENFRPQEVHEAQRMLKPVEILDFDSLRSLALLATGALAQVWNR
ncbi:MAG: hypothetical protein R2733_17395 [Acidimicrobiales bacterium]